MTDENTVMPSEPQKYIKMVDTDYSPHLSYRDQDVLNTLYHDYELTQSEIGELFGVAQSTIGTHMENAGIETRTPGQNSRITVSECQLKQWYVCDGLSASDIGDELGITRQAVYKRLRKYDWY